MKLFLAAIVSFALSLWLGGMVMALITLFYFFATDRSLAVAVGPRIIFLFETMQLIVGVVAVLAMVAWRLLVCTRAKRFILPLLLLALAAAVVVTGLVTPRVNQLWQTGMSNSREFWRWHGISQIIYMFEFVCLLAALLMMPWAISAEATPRKPRLAPFTPVPQTSPQTASA